MVKLTELVTYANGLLAVNSFKDYCPNGLQVEGCHEVRTLVSGVTACRALLEAAIERGADAIVVHHGYFWRGEDSCIVGLKQNRIKLLLTHEISLLGYHLPLDTHPELGNNVQLAKLLGFVIEGRLAESDLAKGAKGLYGHLETPFSSDEFTRMIAQALGREPLHVPGGPPVIRRVGWCTGAAQGFIASAVAQGLDAYISGEISEPTVHVAREAGIHYFAAGHHATERYGVRALGQHLIARFNLTGGFIDIDNPA